MTKDNYHPSPIYFFKVVMCGRNKNSKNTQGLGQILYI